MNIKVPFQKPNVVNFEKYIHYIKDIECNHYFSNFGPINSKFEKRITHEVFGSNGFLTTVNNATIGLILAISQCSRKNARYALMPSFTFAATPLAAKWCGLEPYFVDIDPKTWCLDEGLVRQAVDELGEDLAVVVPYATFGTAMPLGYYDELHRSGIPVVVDAAPGFMGRVENATHGLGFSGSIVYSFHATKPFGIGEGGLVYSGDEELIERIKQASNFGFNDERLVSVLALNGKLAEYPAAVALATLDVFSEKSDKRKTVERSYFEALCEKEAFKNGWSLQDRIGDAPSQFYSVLCPSGVKNQNVVEILGEQGVQARAYFSPSCHMHPLFFDSPRTKLHVTDDIASRIVSLPLWEDMTNDEVCFVVGGLPL